MIFKNREKSQQGVGNDYRRELGAMGESLAIRALKKRGYKILAMNHRTKLGEIDIIAREGGTLAFVEVKTRRTDGFGGPKTAVTRGKQRKISKLALDYLKETGQTNEKARFDVVAIRLSPGHPEIEIIKNAFDLAY